MQNILSALNYLHIFLDFIFKEKTKCKLVFNTHIYFATYNEIFYILLHSI